MAGRAGWWRAVRPVQPKRAARILPGGNAKASGWRLHLSLHLLAVGRAAGVFRSPPARRGVRLSKQLPRGVRARQWGGLIPSGLHERLAQEKLALPRAGW